MVDYADVHEMVTATVFTADGARAVVGTMKGKCRFYQCGAAFKLDYEAQIGTRSCLPYFWYRSVATCGILAITFGVIA